ncbi:MAG: nucleotidyltransferase family protein [Prolixibacteraceae bacterium]|nr:nucleotidyltransferase family protein [Prolixibacteraceae bacterium]
MKAMIFAAGLGTRLLHETSDKPKALVEIGGKTLLQRAIEKLKDEGFDNIVVNVHHFAGQIKTFLQENDFGIQIHISDESGRLLDTGGGLKKASHFLNGNEPVVIYNVDIISNLSLQKLVEYHTQTGALATVVVRSRQTQRYLKFDAQKRLVGWLNKKTGETRISDPKNFINGVEMAYSGIQVIQPKIFDYLPAENKFSVIHWYLELAKNHLIKGYFDDSEIWMDVGKPEQLEKARRLFF